MYLLKAIRKVKFIVQNFFFDLREKKEITSWADVNVNTSYLFLQNSITKKKITIIIIYTSKSRHYIPTYR